MTGMTSRAVASLVRDEADSTAGVGYLVDKQGVTSARPVAPRGAGRTLTATHF
jgi:hypothetical protein